MHDDRVRANHEVTVSLVDHPEPEVDVLHAVAEEWIEAAHLEEVLSAHCHRGRGERREAGLHEAGRVQARKALEESMRDAAAGRKGHPR